jgi:hypothetical protein
MTSYFYKIAKTDEPEVVDYVQHTEQLEIGSTLVMQNEDPVTDRDGDDYSIVNDVEYTVVEEVSEDVFFAKVNPEYV